MGIPRTELKTWVEPFHGITPNSSTMPLGQIKLHITISVPDNFCIEKVTFDVTDVETTYNVIIGPPMVGRFMDVVLHAYQALKIPGPKGVITVKGDQNVVAKCDKQSLEMVEHFYRTTTITKDIESKRQKRQAVSKGKDSAKFDDATKGETDKGVKDKKAGGGTKIVPLDPSKMAKTVRIRADLEPK
ncbi:uncharacterized protein LOC133928040 [Phragmites australis]|uniref:uncharacterized protein LOC133928040 n=1 Tax=Phragmites australis TaxID=29695 RepID=UPI002D79C112|nr:uncharacterized protein LOC133928040 [Phragmites australis]